MNPISLEEENNTLRWDVTRLNSKIDLLEEELLQFKMVFDEICSRCKKRVSICSVSDYRACSMPE